MSSAACWRALAQLVWAAEMCVKGKNQAMRCSSSVWCLFAVMPDTERGAGRDSGSPRGCFPVRSSAFAYEVRSSACVHVREAGNFME